LLLLLLWCWPHQFIQIQQDGKPAAVWPQVIMRLPVPLPMERAVFNIGCHLLEIGDVVHTQTLFAV